MNDPLSTIQQVGILPIARGIAPAHLMTIAGVFLAEGIPIFEVTLNSPDALQTIRALRDAHPHLSVGAGTVLDPAQAAQALEAGAQFLVSPHVDLRVASAARRAQVPWIPGALTPTEILLARDSGAVLIKLFPAAAVGPSYLRHLKAPLPDIELVPTGGISAENAADYLAAGAAAVGVGGRLLGAAATDAAWLRGEIRALQAAVRKGRAVHA